MPSLGDGFDPGDIRCSFLQDEDLAFRMSTWFIKGPDKLHVFLIRKTLWAANSKGMRFMKSHGTWETHHESNGYALSSLYVSLV